MQRSVLLVDDIPEQRDIYDAMLSHAGYRVLHARGGVEAIARALNGSPALIVLDLGLPDLHGLEVFHTLRSHPSTRNVPVLAITADFRRHPPASVLAEGFDGYLSKPVSPVDLLRAVEDLLRVRGAL